MRTLIGLVIFLIGTALGFPFGWWLRGRQSSAEVKRLSDRLKTSAEALDASMKKNNTPKQSHASGHFGRLHR